MPSNASADGGHFITITELRNQWQNPSDVLSVLLIIGGDIVGNAIAQLSGTSIVPVCFSFGWVSYAFVAAFAIFGQGRLMPRPDYHCKVINTDTGYKRENQSWLLGRLLRDRADPSDAASLCVGIYDAVDGPSGQNQIGKPGISKAWIMSVAVITLQLGVAAVPFGIYGDWGVFMITIAGTTLALVTGSMPQFRAEKYACRTGSKKNVALTRGNGSRYVMVILGNGKSLDLEDLSTAEDPRVLRVWNRFGCFLKPAGSGENKNREPRIFRGLPLDFWYTRAVCVVTAFCWLVVLIIVAALEDHSWFLLLVGAMGMLQNAIVAAIPRSVEAQGIFLNHRQNITGYKAMDVLMDLELECKGVGACLVEEFFPGHLRSAEKAWWAGDREEYNKARAERQKKVESSSHPLPQSHLP